VYIVQAIMTVTEYQTNRTSMSHPYLHSCLRTAYLPIGLHLNLPLMHYCTVTPSPGVPPRGNRGCLLAHGLHFGGTQGPWRPYACGSATSHGTRNPHNRWRRRGGGAASPDAGRFLDRIRVRVR